MNGKVIFSFVAGAAVGVAAAWKYAKQKFKRIADEEIASVKEAFSDQRSDGIQKYRIVDDMQKNGATKEEIETVGLYIQKYSDCNYAVSDGGGKDADKKIRQYNKAAADYNPAEKDPKHPYVITPDEYGNREGFLAVTFTYFEDGVVTDEMDNIVEDVDEAIGTDFVRHFGEYEDDSVFIRNDTRHCDYEILRDYRNYSDTPYAEV